MSRESTYNAGDTGHSGLISGSGRPPGGGRGNPCQYSCLGNSMDKGAWQATVYSVTKSQTWLKQMIKASSTDAREQIQARFYRDPCCKGEQEQTTVSLTCFLAWRWGRQACSLYGVRVRVCTGVEAEGWLRCFPHPSGGVECRRHAQYPTFASNTLSLLYALQKWPLGFLISLSRI